jgi:hypothetical protein
MSCGALHVNGGLVDTFYINSGASDYLVSSQGLTENSQGEISAASSGRAHANSTGTPRMASFVKFLGQEEDLQNVYFTPGFMRGFCRLANSE